MNRQGAAVDPKLERGVPSGDPLTLSASEMRELGYRTVDLIVEQLTDSAIPAMRLQPPRRQQPPTAAAPRAAA